MGQNGYFTRLGFIVSLISVATCALPIGEIANSLKVGYNVQRNGIPLTMGPTSITTYLANITLENIGTKPIPPDGWHLHICHDKLIHPMFYNVSTSQYAGGGLILPGNFTVVHTKGCMFEITPYQGENVNFKALPINPGDIVVIPIVSSEFFVSKYSAFPNWYVSDGNFTVLIPNTIDDKAMSFVGPFDSDIQFTRFINDFDSIVLSPIDRYRGYNFTSPAETKSGILPTPFQVNPGSGSVTVDNSWFIDSNGKQNLERIARFLQTSIKNEVGLNLKIQDFADGTPNGIQIIESTPVSSGGNREAYTLSINPATKRVIINGYSKAAIKNGIHSLRSLLAGGKTLNAQTINDTPRMSYRGLEFDISDNFYGPNEIRKVIDLMGMYKLNKLVLVLAGENGWRIEIPGIPELTQVGGKRCHDVSETNCLFSQLGSLPDGSDGGFLSQAQYQDLVSYADDRNVEIIPLINMASKARAAIKAMTARGDNTMMLQDPNDRIHYMTPSLFSDSAVNPCLPNNSTVLFFKTVLQSLKNYHNAAGVPLKHIHVGGEDSPPPAWLGSIHCRNLLPLEQEDLYLEIKVNYSMAIGDIAEKEGVKLIALDEFYIAWPSRLPFERIRPFMTPFRRTRFPAENNFFDTISISKTFDQLPQGHRAQHMADNDYKVILQPDDYFSLDFAAEPNPNMPGAYNERRRYINATRIFNFLPDNLCCNYQLSDEGSFGCADVNNCLELVNRSNILGMQATLGTRYVKDASILFKLLAPRIIAYAERAWHKASWEDTYKVHPMRFSPQTGPQIDIQTPDLDSRDKDWVRVASIIGHKEYKRMLGVAMPEIPPPGAIKRGNILRVDTAYPGLTPMIKTPSLKDWAKIAPVTDVSSVRHPNFTMKSVIAYQLADGLPRQAEGMRDVMTLNETHSERQKILIRIANIRQQMILEQQRQMERAREMERRRQEQIEAFMRAQQTAQFGQTNQGNMQTPGQGPAVAGGAAFPGVQPGAANSAQGTGAAQTAGQRQAGMSQAATFPAQNFAGMPPTFGNQGRANGQQAGTQQGRMAAAAGGAQGGFPAAGGRAQGGFPAAAGGAQGGFPQGQFPG